MAIGSTSSGPSRDADPLIHWRLVEMAEQQPGLIGDPVWWSVMVELRDTSLSRFLQQTEHANGGPLDAILLVPPLYQAQAARHRSRRIVTLYATQQFLKLILERDGLGVGRVLLGRQLPAPPPGSTAPIAGPQPARPPGAPRARAIVAVIDDGIAFAHELFRRADGGTRVEFAWLQDGEPSNMPRGRELRRPEIDALLAQHERNGRLDEDGFYRAAGLIDFASGLHKSAAFRRSHGTHVAALAGGYRPGTADDDFPLILVQLAAENVADTSGDRIEPDLGLALQYIVDRAEAVAAARGMGNALPLVINFSFGTNAGPHDGTDLLDTLIAEIEDSVQRPLRLVLPAGNSNLARCHAVLPGGDREAHALHWRLLPDDRTASYLEIWLPHRGPQPPDLVAVEVRTPDGTASARVSATPGAARDIVWNGTVVARLHYAFAPFPTERGVIRVAVRPTASHRTRSIAPSGLWRVQVSDQDLRAGESVHLRVQRSESLPGYPLRGRQSFLEQPGYQRFDAIGLPLAVDPAGSGNLVTRSGTLNAYATGARTVVIGAYERVRGQPGAYSAAGPVSPIRDAQSASRVGPDALAASDDSTVTAGVMSAGSRSGSRVAIGGTSVAAPQVARWLAVELAEGRPGDRGAVRQRAAADEQGTGWDAERPPEDRGGGRLALPAQPGWPRRLVPPRP